MSNTLVLLLLPCTTRPRPIGEASPLFSPSLPATLLPGAIFYPLSFLVTVFETPRTLARLHDLCALVHSACLPVCCILQ